MANRPINKWRASNIEVAIWHNTKEQNGEEIGFKTVSLSRSYKKKNEDIWRSEVINLRRADIPKVIAVLNKAFDELILDQKQQESESDG